MENKRQENGGITEKEPIDWAAEREKNGWISCGIPANNADWDWRKAVSERAEEE